MATVEQAVTYIDESINNYHSLLNKFNDLSIKLDTRLTKIEKHVDIGTDYILGEFNKTVEEPNTKPTPVKKPKTATKKKTEKEVPKKEAPKIETEAPKKEAPKIETESEAPKKEEPKKEEPKKELPEKKKFEKLVDFFVYDYPLNPLLYKEFIPSKVSLTLSPEEIYKKTAVKSNSKLNEFAALARQRKEDFNNTI